jgi:hypothetical protein
MSITRPRLRFPSPALILSGLALFVAGGGSTYAATAVGASGIHFTNAKLKNGWTSAGSHFGAPGYAKDSLGVVHLRGGLKNGFGDPAFVLPKGLRPTHELALPVYTYADTEGSLIIAPNGNVAPLGSNANSYTSLAGISFPTGS